MCSVLLDYLRRLVERGEARPSIADEKRVFRRELKRIEKSARKIDSGKGRDKPLFQVAREGLQARAGDEGDSILHFLASG